MARAILDGVNTYFTRQPPPGSANAACIRRVFESPVFFLARFFAAFFLPLAGTAGASTGSREAVELRGEQLA